MFRDLRTFAIDAQKIAKEHPDTFTAPSQHDLCDIAENDFIKIAFNGERFWSRVIGINVDDIVAVVDNTILDKSRGHLDLGSLICVKKSQVYQIKHM